MPAATKFAALVKAMNKRDPVRRDIETTIPLLRSCPFV
jgi:hypothetical protein